MYPSWGNYGGGHQPPPHHFAIRPPHITRDPQPPGGGFGGYGAPPPAPGSNFSSLREQHLQQMQQLQQLHQKQLQSVLHQNSGSYGGGPTTGAPGSWQGGGVGGAEFCHGPGNVPPSNNNHDQQQSTRGPPVSVQPQPPQPVPHQQEEAPPQPPPEPTAEATPPQENPVPDAQTNKNETPKEPGGFTAPTEDEKPNFSSMTLQEQQQYWYKQHLQNLQKLKNEKARQNQIQADSHQKSTAAPPPPAEPPKKAPPPPPPKEEPPPPPPPEDKPSGITAPGDPAEAARLQQLQAAAAHWQHAQQQRAGYQYQALMQEHSQLQQILQQYQQFIQQPAHLQTMPMDMQLRHYEVQQQQFAPVFQEWDLHFKLWQDQFQAYPHKDQLQDYELQWKQWQEQMNSTSAHLLERVSTLRAMQHQYGTGTYGGMMGHYGHHRHPGPEAQMQMPPPVAASMLPPANMESQVPAVSGLIGSSTAQSSPTPTTTASYPLSGPENLSEPFKTAGPVQGVRPQGPQACFEGPRGPPGPQARFEGPRGPPGPQARFEGPRGPPGPQARFEGPRGPPGPQARFEGPRGPPGPQARFEGPRGPPGPQARFEGPRGPPGPQARFEGPRGPPGPQARFEGPRGPPGPQARFEGPRGPPGPQARFEGPRGPPGPQARFEGPRGPPGPQARFEGQSGPRFDGPRGNDGPKFEQLPQQQFNTPPRFEPRERFDQPPRGNQPRLGAPGRFEPPPRQSPPSRFERPPGPPPPSGLGPQFKPAPVTQSKLQPAKSDTALNLKPENLTAEQQKSTTQDQTVKDGLTAGGSLSDDLLDSGNGFFVQSDPIPQTKGPETSKKTEDLAPEEKEKEEKEKEKTTADTSKAPVSMPSSVPPKQAVPTANETPLNQSAGPPKNIINNGPPQRPQPPTQGPPKPDMPSQPPGVPQGENQTVPPHLARGRGRGQIQEPVQGRGRGQPAGPLDPPPHGFGPNSQRQGEEMEEIPYYRSPHEMRHQEEAGFEWEDPSLEAPGGMDCREQPPEEEEEEEMWQPEEHHFPEEYYEEGAEQGPPEGRGEPPEGHWEEREPEYWEEGDPYWMERRPPIRPGAPFPHEQHRRPPPPHGFMHRGPRRLPPHPEDLEHDPRKPPLHHMTRDPMGPPMHHDHDQRGPPLHHSMMERDMRRPPPPREMLERDPRGPPPFHDSMDREPGWPHPPNAREPRRPPPPPHEVMERGLRRPPMGPPHPVARDMRRPPPPDEDTEGMYEQGYGDDFGPEDDGYRRPPPRDYHPRDYEHGEEEFYRSREEWDMERPDGDFPPYPHRGQPERIREDQWPEKRERLYPYEEEERGMADHRGPSYPDDPPYRGGECFQTRPDWERPPPPPERGYPPDVEDRRSSFDTHSEPSMELPPPALGPQSSIPDPSLEQSSPGAAKGVLALSQRQHEIILKAAQELKMIRELQESNSFGEFSKPEATELQPDIPAGLLGLEIPPEVKSALQATHLMSEPGQTASGKPMLWDAGLASQAQDQGFLHSQTSAPVALKPALITKTVDYGHGHDIGATVERISYGERIVLRPDPMPSERPYEKEPLGPRDPYRDQYYDRRTDPYMDRREYSREREREMYREKPPMDYERERYERERYPRDERLPPGPPRPGYRDRERDLRGREGRSSSSRDRELYSRPPYDRPPYDRGPERYDHGSSGYGGDRRSYPDDRPPAPPPSLPPQPPAPAPRVEKKPEMKNVEDILKPPGRANRPERIVIVMRGLPGSGKSHVAKLIRDKEVECGGAPPRILGLDDYFMTEVEKMQKDPDSGKRVKQKVLEYEYEPEMEDTYRNSMLKTFRKTLDDGFFPFIIIDAINDKVKYFDQFWSAAKTKGFEVYVAEVTADNQICAKRNIHGRKLKDITKMSGSWESSPRHMVRLDIRSLLQDAAIEEVEMEDFSPSEEAHKADAKKEEDEEGDRGYIPKSKWEMDTSEGKLDKLDGLGSGGKRKRDSDMSEMEDFLQLPDDYATRMSEPGKKRVRWADLEEQKDADRKRAIGFVVGQTDWEKITDESGQLAQRALNRTKYF